jgi:hypothetical protein
LASGAIASAPLAGAPSGPASAPNASHPAAHPSTSTTVAVKFYGTNSTFANFAPTSDPCGVAYQNFSNYAFNYTDNNTFVDCYGGAQNPSLLNLSNGNLGVAYSTYTTNETNCTVDQSQVVSRVGFQVSTDSGATFGAAQYLGNQTCAYLQAIEPSFGVSTSGTVYGTFVEENATNTSNTFGISLPTDYANRTADALGFTSSTNNGASFAPVSTVGAAGVANIARPQLAAFGKTVYIVYDALNNWTNLTLNQSMYSPYPASHPIAVDLVYSVDGGARWHGPYTLPGLNGSAGYSAQSPSISVSSTGELAVAYATDRSCQGSNFFFGCNVYQDAAVVATSSTNGTTWSAPMILGTVGETHEMGYDNDTAPSYWYDGYAYQFQVGPELTVAWSDISSSTLFAAWAGEYLYTTPYGTGEGESGVFSAASTNGGSTWANGTVAAPGYTPYYVDEYAYDPALVVHGGTAYLTYTDENESYCYGTSCNPFAEKFSYWMVNSTNGTFWGTPTYLTGDATDYYETEDSWDGYNNAIAYTSDGPVASFSQPQYTVSGFGYSSYTYPNGTTSNFYWNNETAQTDLTVALPWTGSTVAVNVSEDGLPAGTAWSVNFSGLTFNLTVTTLVLTGIPIGQLMYYSESGTPSGGYWAQYKVLYGTSGLGPFYAAGNITFNFELEYGFTLAINPSAVPDFYFDDFIGNTYFEWDHCGANCNYFSEPFPWFVPAGSYVYLGPGTVNSDPVGPIAFTGYGNGSSSVVASTTSITVNGPINETIWFGALGMYPVTFAPSGLAPTSTYSFQFNGTTYTANGTQDVTVPDVLTGAYAITNITATSATAGWAAYGVASTGGTVVVPNEVNVQLNFSSVDVAAPAGTVSFEAQGLALGDFWTMTFNGSELGSTTPWINVTAHPGNYSVSAAPIPASVNESSAYVPQGFGPILSVTPSTTYVVPYSATYRVDVAAGSGGSVTGAGTQWLAPGTVVNFSATPHTDYTFLGWSGTGAGSYSGLNLNASVTVGGAITESANFLPVPANRFDLRFNASGLPAGTWWTVTLGGVGYSTDASTLVVPNLYPCNAGAEGQYALTVPESFLNGSAGTRFLAGGYPGSVCTTGTTSVTIGFGAEYLVTPIASGGGGAAVVVAGVSSTGALWVSTGTTVGLREQAHLNYVFLGWSGVGPGAYTGPLGTATFTPTGPVAETAAFSAVVPPPPITYWLSVHTTTALAPNTSWAITLSGAGYSTTGNWINLTALAPGSYSFGVATTLAPDRLTEYTPLNVRPTVDLTNNTTVSVSFGISYWVSETASPGGSLGGATSGFTPSGHTLSLSATPAVGFDFVQWQGAGTGAYSGTNATATVVVTAPITEVASFTPLAPSTSSGTTSVGPGSVVVIAALAIVGLVVGLAVGYVVLGRRPPSTGGSA